MISLLLLDDVQRSLPVTSSNRQRQKIRTMTGAAKKDIIPITIQQKKKKEKNDGEDALSDGHACEKKSIQDVKIDPDRERERDDYVSDEIGINEQQRIIFNENKSVLVYLHIRLSCHLIAFISSSTKPK